MGWHTDPDDGSTYWRPNYKNEVVKDETGSLIYMEDYYGYIIQPHFGEYEAWIQNNDSWHSRVYRMDTPTNWTFLRIDKSFQCYGDWDNDGIEDFMYTDGEVVLGSLPEPFIPLFMPIAIGIICRLKKPRNHSVKFNTKNNEN